MAGAADEFWTWSVGFYAEPGIEGILLDLQDRLGLDVNMLLFACWNACKGRRRLAAQEWTRLIEGTAGWRNRILAPLRSLRRQLKSEPRTAAAGLRTRIKELELDAERVAQKLLLEIASIEDGSSSGMHDCRAEAMAGMEDYTRQEGVSLGHADVELLKELACACCAAGCSPGGKM